MPESNIFLYGFDKNLNRNVEVTLSPLVYDSINDATQTQTLQYGASIAGSQNSLIVQDPAKGFWIGHAKFSSAPFKVSMNGEFRSANLTRLGGLYTRTNVTSTGTDVLTLSIPGGAMATQGTIRVTMHITNNSGNSVTVDTSLGGTVFANDIPLVGGVGALSKQVIDITNLNSTSSQVSSVVGLQVTPTVTIQTNTGTVDTSAAQDLVVTVNTGGGAIDCFVEYIFVELIV